MISLQSASSKGRHPALIISLGKPQPRPRMGTPSPLDKLLHLCPRHMGPPCVSNMSKTFLTTCVPTTALGGQALSSYYSQGKGRSERFRN